MGSLHCTTLHTPTTRCVCANCCALLPPVLPTPAHAYAAHSVFGSSAVSPHAFRFSLLPAVGSYQHRYTCALCAFRDPPVILPAVLCGVLYTTYRSYSHRQLPVRWVSRLPGPPFVVLPIRFAFLPPCYHSSILDTFSVLAILPPTTTIYPLVWVCSPHSPRLHACRGLQHRTPAHCINARFLPRRALVSRRTALVPFAPRRIYTAACCARHTHHLGLRFCPHWSDAACARAARCLRRHRHHAAAPLYSTAFSHLSTCLPAPPLPVPASTTTGATTTAACTALLSRSCVGFPHLPAFCTPAFMHTHLHTYCLSLHHTCTHLVACCLSLPATVLGRCTCHCLLPLLRVPTAACTHNLLNTAQEGLSGTGTPRHHFTSSTHLLHTGYGFLHTTCSCSAVYLSSTTFAFLHSTVRYYTTFLLTVFTVLGCFPISTTVILCHTPPPMHSAFFPFYTTTPWLVPTYHRSLYIPHSSSSTPLRSYSPCTLVCLTTFCLFCLLIFLPVRSAHASHCLSVHTLRSTFTPAFLHCHTAHYYGFTIWFSTSTYLHAFTPLHACYYLPLYLVLSSTHTMHTFATTTVYIYHTPSPLPSAHHHTFWLVEFCTPAGFCLPFCACLHNFHAYHCTVL